MRFSLRAPSLAGDEGLDALASIYKTYSENIRLKENSEFNRAKSTVASLINSYNTAGSQALQQEIVKSMQRYQAVLPPDLKEAVQPYIAHGPTSPVAEKRRQFIQQFKPPKAPVFNEATGEAADLENKSKYIDYQFKLHDYNRALKIFMLGKEAAGDKLTFLPLADGSAAVRTKNDMIVQLSAADLKLKELSEKYGLDPKDIVLNNGEIPTGKKGFAFMNGRKITTEEVYRPFAPKGEQYGNRVTGVQEQPKSAWDIEHPARLSKLLLDWKNPHPKDEGLQELKKRAVKSKESRKAVEDELSTMFPKYSFRIMDKKDKWFWRVLDWTPFIGWFVSVDNQQNAIIPIRGKPIPIPDKSGKMFTYYYDQNIDLVSDQFGRPIGTYQEAITKIGGSEVRTTKELK